MPTELQVRRDDTAQTRIFKKTLPTLANGEVLVEIESFALTANNITYAVIGERIGYWKFFPAGEGWGVVPAWGIAKVVQSRCELVCDGHRLYGYFPMGTHLVIRPVKVSERRLFDGMDHRAELPPVYNAYSRLDAEAGAGDAMGAERMLLLPLYATSYCLYDFLKDRNWCGASQIVIGSASSKTAIGLAYALNDDATAPKSVGLTSAGNAVKVSALGLYGSVAFYTDIGTISREPTVIVDMSGDGSVMCALHDHLGDKMLYCSAVGLTHHDKGARDERFIAARTEMFFAPGHIQKRAVDWGPGVFDGKAHQFWRDAAERSRSWLRLQRVNGIEAAEIVFHEVRRGAHAPETGIIVQL